MGYQGEYKGRNRGRRLTKSARTAKQVASQHKASMVSAQKRSIKAGSPSAEAHRRRMDQPLSDARRERLTRIKNDVRFPLDVRRKARDVLVGNKQPKVQHPSGYAMGVD